MHIFADHVRYSRQHPANHPALGLEARVPPPWAAPAVLRRVVLSLLSIKRIRLRAVLTWCLDIECYNTLSRVWYESKGGFSNRACILWRSSFEISRVWFASRLSKDSAATCPQDDNVLLCRLPQTTLTVVVSCRITFRFVSILDVSGSKQMRSDLRKLQNCCFISNDIRTWMKASKSITFSSDDLAWATRARATTKSPLKFARKAKTYICSFLPSAPRNVNRPA